MLSYKRICLPQARSPSHSGNGRAADSRDIQQAGLAMICKKNPMPRARRQVSEGCQSPIMALGDVYHWPPTFVYVLYFTEF